MNTFPGLVHTARHIMEAVCTRSRCVNRKETGAEAAATNITMKRKVIKGGSWKDVAYFIQNGSRTYEYQDTSKSYVGFRCIQNYIGRSNKDRK